MSMTMRSAGPQAIPTPAEGLAVHHASMYCGLVVAAWNPWQGRPAWRHGQVLASCFRSLQSGQFAAGVLRPGASGWTGHPWDAHHRATECRDPGSAWPAGEWVSPMRGTRIVLFGLVVQSLIGKVPGHGGEVLPLQGLKGLWFGKSLGPSGLESLHFYRVAFYQFPESLWSLQAPAPGTVPTLDQAICPVLGVTEGTHSPPLGELGVRSLPAAGHVPPTQGLNGSCVLGPWPPDLAGARLTMAPGEEPGRGQGPFPP